MKGCPHCNSQNPESAIACHACGEPFNAPQAESVPAPQPERGLATRIYLAALAVLVIAGLAYRHLSARGLEQSAALFIGIPALVGTLLALAPVPKSRTGLILRTMALGLLLSGPLLGEGFICILMAAPLFLAVGVVIGFFADRAAKRKSGRDKLYSLVPVPILAAMSLEGTAPQLSFNRHETVEVTQTVLGTPDQVACALAARPRFELRPTGILAIGWPVPLEGTGCALERGNRRTVHFSGGEGRPPGDLELEVTESEPGRVRFKAVSDTSHLRHWLRWLGSEVRWEAANPGSTRVTWTVHFERSLDPAWYFGLPERFMVRRSAAYLVKTCATP
jgi:hypothetical protein